MSETGRCRERLKHFCEGNGLDLGYGGDPIVPWAITVDLPQPYVQYEPHAPQHLKGDATRLSWFNDGVLDFVYSSHLLEDFEDTAEVMKEWLRVLRYGGYLVLYLPDEQAFRAHCQKTGQEVNDHHKHVDFSLGFVLKLMTEETMGRPFQVVHSAAHVDDYGFELVIRAD